MVLRKGTGSLSAVLALGSDKQDIQALTGVTALPRSAGSPQNSSEVLHFCVYGEVLL